MCANKILRHRPAKQPPPHQPASNVRDIALGDYAFHLHGLLTDVTAVLTSLADLTGVTGMPGDLRAGIQELVLIRRPLTDWTDEVSCHLRAI